MEDCWSETRQGKIAVLTFARPPRNWMNLRLEGRLFAKANASDEARQANASVPRPEAP